MDGGQDVAHTALGIRRLGKEWQRSFSNIENCGKAVIACVHGACIGGGIEMSAIINLSARSDAYIAASTLKTYPSAQALSERIWKESH